MVSLDAKTEHREKSQFHKYMKPIKQNKSHDEYEDEDQEVDGLGFDEEPQDYDRQNEGIVGNLALANFNEDIEEIEGFSDPRRSEKKKKNVPKEKSS